MANRTYYAVKAAGIAADGVTSYTEIHGLQSVGITTSFNLEQVFEIGQVEIYENIENIPDIEVTLEKVIDGYPLIYHLATRDANSGTLSGRSAAKCTVALSIFNEDFDSASGVPLAEVECSGMFASAVSYTMPVDGNCTESVTLVGNHKLWKSTSFNFPTGGGTIFNNADTPLAAQSGLGGVQRRENVVFAGSNYTILPSQIPGISSSGTNDKINDQYGTHVQSISVSTDLGREALNELGRRNPYFRFVNFPVEVTCDIEIISTSGDWISATEEGTLGDGNNLSSEEIRIVLEDTTNIYLGTNNKLSSVTYGGGDATGGNDAITYSYTNFNSLTVTHVQDPAGL